MLIFVIDDGKKNSTVAVPTVMMIMTRYQLIYSYFPRLKKSKVKDLRDGEKGVTDKLRDKSYYSKISRKIAAVIPNFFLSLLSVGTVAFTICHSRNQIAHRGYAAKRHGNPSLIEKTAN